MSWERIPGWTDGHLHELYEQQVRDASSTQQSVFVEVGVAFGRSAGLMATLIEAAGKPIQFVGVDCWLRQEWKETELAEAIAAAGSFHEACVAYLKGELTPEQLRRITLHTGDSVDVASRFQASIDFCFIDGWHEEESVSRDIDAWLPKMRTGGLIAGHDHTGAWPGVERAVRARFGAPGAGYDVSGSCWKRRT